MNDLGLMPDPPQWALRAGLPAPNESEGFCEYAVRLGYDPQELLVDLTPQTIELAHGRLATKLQRSMPTAFASHVKKLADRYRPTPVA